MTRASPSPNSGAAEISRHALAGPLDVEFDVPAGPLRDVIAANLALYDVPWTHGPTKPVRVTYSVSEEGQSARAAGDYIEAARMRVDKTPNGMYATTERGASMAGVFTADGEDWHLGVPPTLLAEQRWWEIEDLLSLVLTTGWRRAGWVPLHAAALTDGTRGVLVCASGGGGKTTFMMAMARAGWKALGDDKLLLRSDGARPLIVALKHMLNVDPKVVEWFPEIGDLRGLPEYSAWTPKRRVSLGSLWPDSPAFAMHPTTIVSLERQSGPGGPWGPGMQSSPGALTGTEMDAASTMTTILRQTVIPGDPDEARWITGTLAACVRGARGIRLLVGDGAYADRDAIATFADHVS